MPTPARVPLRIFACDPGLTSGVCELGYNRETDRIEKIWSEEVSQQDVGHRLTTFVETYGPDEAEVVAERFTISVQSAKMGVKPYSSEVIGTMRWIVHNAWGTPWVDSILLQTPAQAKRLVPNEILKKGEIWHRGGAGHAMDALRHGVFRYAAVGVRSIWENP